MKITKEGMTEWFDIGRGVRQGCSLPTTLFNIYIEDIINNILDGEEGDK